MSIRPDDSLVALRASLEHLEGYAVQLDGDNRVVWLSRSARAMLEERSSLRGPFVGARLTELTPNLASGQLREHLARARSTGQRVSFTERYDGVLRVDYTLLPGGPHLLLLGRTTDESTRQRSLLDEVAELISVQVAILWSWDHRTDTTTLWMPSEDGEAGYIRRTSPWLDSVSGFPEADRKRMRAALEACAAGGGSFTVEHAIVNESGAVHHYQARIVRTTLDGEERVLGLTVDVTELRAAERAVRDSNERFQLASEALGLGVWDLDLETDVAHVSPVACRVLGLEPGPEVRGFPCAQARVHPGDTAAVQSSWARCLAGEGPFDIVFRVRHLDGSWGAVHSFGDVVRREGRSVRVVGWVSDVTAERRSRLLNDVTERIALVGGWSMDLASREVFWTEGTYRVFGLEAGRSPPSLEALSELHVEEDRERVRQLVALAMREGRDYRYEAGVRRADGQVRRVLVNATASRTEDGTGTVYGSVQDITDRHLLEQQLRRSQRLDSLGRLASGIAHDFNNLLAAVSGNAEVLRDGLTDSNLRELADDIVDAAHRGHRLTRQLTTFARQGLTGPQGRQEVWEAVDGLLRLVRPLLPDGVDLRVSDHERAMFVGLNPAPLEQLLMNLVLNARDAVGSTGTIQITVDDAVPPSGRTDQDPLLGWVRIRVADDGEGMTEEVRERVFEPFYTTKAAGVSSGLGLATVYGVVRSAGGVVELTSTPGEGTVFDIYLPAVEPGSSPGLVSSVDEPASDGGLDLLLVEDDLEVRRMARRVLRRGGHRVRDVGSAREALASVEERGMPDVVVTDVTMPEISGIDLSVALRAQQPGLGIVYITGYAEQALPFDDSGCCLVRKPFSVVELMEAVTAVSAGAQRRL